MNFLDPFVPYSPGSEELRTYLYGEWGKLIDESIRDRLPFVYSLSSRDLSLGQVAWKKLSMGKSIFLKNEGFLPIKLDRITAVGDFTVSCVTSGVVEPGEQIEIVAQFFTQRAGLHTGGIFIDMGGPERSAFIELKAIGLDADGLPGDDLLPPALLLDIPDLNFGQVTVGTLSAPQNLQITSVSDMVVVIEQLAFSSPEYAALNTSFPLVMNPGQTVLIPIYATPSSVGAKQGSVLVINSYGVDLSAGLAVTGTAMVPVIPLTITPEVRDYGFISNQIPSSVQWTVQNHTNQDIPFDGVTLIGGDASEHTWNDFDGQITPGQMVPANSTVKIGGQFTPNANGAFARSFIGYFGPHTLEWDVVGTTPEVDAFILDNFNRSGFILSSTPDVGGNWSGDWANDASAPAPVMANGKAVISNGSGYGYTITTSATLPAAVQNIGCETIITDVDPNSRISLRMGGPFSDLPNARIEGLPGSFLSVGTTPFDEIPVPGINWSQPIKVRFDVHIITGQWRIEVNDVMVHSGGFSGTNQTEGMTVRCQIHQFSRQGQGNPVTYQLEKMVIDTSGIWI